MVSSLHPTEQIRRVVAHNRNRYHDEFCSLDLTYIIPGRLMATSYPATGLESFGRNHINTVSFFDINIY